MTEKPKPKSWEDYLTVFDTETTGFGPLDRIVEIAVVTYFEGREVRCWEIMLDPGLADASEEQLTSWQQAFEVNHIDPEQLRGRPTFEQMAPMLRAEMTGDGILVAHNAVFDIRMLRQEADRCGYILDSILEKPCFDTMLADLGLNPGRMSRKLGAVAERWGVTVQPTHRALADARACGLAALKMADKFPHDYAEVEEDMRRWGAEWEAITRNWKRKKTNG